MQHATQYTHVEKWLQESGGADVFRQDNPDIAAQMKRSVPGLKAIVQSVRSPATGYFNNLRRGLNSPGRGAATPSHGPA